MADDQVNVAITATSDQLEAEVNQAAEAMDAGTQRMIELLEQLVAASTSSTAEIVANEEKLAEAVIESSEESAEAVEGMAARMTESFAQAREGMEGFAERIGGIQKMFALLAEVAIFGFIGEKVADLAKEFGEFGEQTEIAAKKTGLSTDAVQELGFAANMTGVSTEGMNQAMMRVSRAMTQAEGGSKQMVAVFESVGLSAKELEGMSVDEVLGKIANKFSETEDGSTKAAIAMQLFGRAGGELIPLLDKGSKGIEELRQKAQQLGIVLSEQDVEAGEEFNEKLKQMDAQMSNLKIRIGNDLVPEFGMLIDKFTESYEEGGSVKVMMEGITVVAQTLGVVINTLVGTFQEFATRAEGAAHALMDWAHNAVLAGAAGANLDEADVGGIRHNNRSAETDAKLHEQQKREQMNNLMILNPQDFVKGANQDQNDRMEGAPKEEGKKGKLKAPDASGGSGPSDVDLWKEQLQEKHDASNDYFNEDLAGDKAFWEQKLALTTKGTKDWLGVQHELHQVNSELAHQSLAEDLATMHEEMATAESGSVQKIEIASREAARIGASYGYQSAQYRAALAEMLKAGKEYTDRQTADADAAIQKQTAALLAGIARQEDAEKAKYKTHQTTTAEETASLLALENQRYDIVSDELAKEMALYEQTSQKYKDLQKQKEKADQEHAANTQKIENQGAQQVQQAWDQAFKSIDSSINSSIMGMIKGTQTLQQSLLKVADQILNSMINVVLQIAERWVQQEAMKVAASEGTSRVLQALGLQDAATAAATQTANAIQQVASNAAVAASGAYAATAVIPYVGPALAPAAAAEAYASTLAFEGMASAAGGYYDVPNDGPVNIHQGEMVLPSWAAQGMRDMIGGPGASGGHTFNNNMTVNNQGITDANFRAMAMKHADVLTRAVNGQIRNFQRS